MSYSSLMTALPLMLMLLLLAAQYDGSDAFAFVGKAPSIKSKSSSSLAVAMSVTAPPPPPQEQVVSASASASSSASTTAYSSSPSNLPPQKELAEQSKSKSTKAAPSVISKDTTAPSTPPPKSTNVASGTGITISDIHYNGDVPKTEADEYVVISNNLKTPIDISGYYLYVATTGTQGPTFTFPKGTTLAPGGSSSSNNKATVRIYTNEIHKETGGYSFNSGKAIWKNNGGLAVLKDAKGKKIMEYKYTN